MFHIALHNSQARIYLRVKLRGIQQQGSFSSSQSIAMQLRPLPWIRNSFRFREIIASITAKHKKKASQWDKWGKCGKHCFSIITFSIGDEKNNLAGSIIEGIHTNEQNYTLVSGSVFCLKESKIIYSIYELLDGRMLHTYTSRLMLQIAYRQRIDDSFQDLFGQKKLHPAFVQCHFPLLHHRLQ